jgi:hypothetical protein
MVLTRGATSINKTTKTEIYSFYRRQGKKPGLLRLFSFHAVLLPTSPHANPEIENETKFKNLICEKFPALKELIVLVCSNQRVLNDL